MTQIFLKRSFVIIFTAFFLSFLFLFAVPAPSFAQTSEGADTVALQLQIDALLEQVNALLSQISELAGGENDVTPPSSMPPTSSETASCAIYLTRTLSLGSRDASTGGEVTGLQEFLARDTAVYPEGLVTGYFGPLTQSAVRRLQVKAGIVSSGTPDTTGYGLVGPKTRAHINTSCPGGSVSGGSGSIGTSGPTLTSLLELPPTPSPVKLVGASQVSISVDTDASAYLEGEDIVVRLILRSIANAPLLLTFEDTNCPITFGIYPLGSEESIIPLGETCSPIAELTIPSHGGVRYWEFKVLDPDIFGFVPGGYKVVGQLPQYGENHDYFQVRGIVESATTEKTE